MSKRNHKIRKSQQKQARRVPLRDRAFAREVLTPLVGEGQLEGLLAALDKVDEQQKREYAASEYAASNDRKLDDLGQRVLDTWIDHEEIDEESIATFHRLTGSPLSRTHLERYVDDEIDEFIPAPLSTWYETHLDLGFELAKALTEQYGAPTTTNGNQLTWVVRR